MKKRRIVKLLLLMMRIGIDLIILIPQHLLSEMERDDSME